jgi:hypothetical protein
MFGPSLKSVPGCLVSIVPMRIGDPVAAVPGLVPHFEVSTEAELLPPPELELADPPPPPGGALVLELLLPQPARMINPSTNATGIARRRQAHTERWNILILSSR